MADRNPNIEKLAKKVGERYEYRSLTFWAEHGGVHIWDQDPTPQDPCVDKVVSLPKWMERVKTMKQYLAAAERDLHVGSQAQIASKVYHVESMRSLVQAMQAVAKQAEQQGDLTNPNVQKFYDTHVAPVAQTYQVPSIILP